MILLIIKLIYYNLMLANMHSFLLWGHLIVGLHSKLHFVVEMLFLLS